MKSLFKSFIYALHGIWSGVADQRNLKFQIAVAVVVVGRWFLYFNHAHRMVHHIIVYCFGYRA